MENQNLNDLNGSPFVIAIAVDISGRKSKLAIIWALANLIPGGGTGPVSIKLIHVFPPIKSAPNPMGPGEIPISRATEDVVTGLRKKQQFRTNGKLAPYQILCLQKKVPVEVAKIESDDIVNAIAKEIRESNIKKLVIGASSARGIFSKGRTLSTKISEGCRSFCTVYSVSIGKSILVRQADPKTILRDETINDPGMFGNGRYSPNHSMKEWIKPDPSAPPLPYSQNKFDQFGSPMKQGFERLMNFADLTRTWSGDNFGQNVDDASTSGASSFKSTATDIYPWETDQFSIDFPSRSEINNNSEVELEKELRKARQMHVNAQAQKTYETSNRDDENSKALPEKNAAQKIATFGSIYSLQHFECASLKVGQKVILKSWDDSSKTVAIGHVESVDPSKEVGEMVLGKKFCEVRVIIGVEVDEELVRPLLGFNTIGEVIGKSIAWPIKSVQLDES